MKALLLTQAAIVGTMGFLFGKKVGLKMGLCMIGINFILGGVNL